MGISRLSKIKSLGVKLFQMFLTRNQTWSQQDMEITLFPHGNDLQMVGFSRSESRLVGGFISPMSLWFLLVIYRTSFHGIITQLITWEGTTLCECWDFHILFKGTWRLLKQVSQSGEQLGDRRVDIIHGTVYARFFDRLWLLVPASQHRFVVAVCYV